MLGLGLTPFPPDLYLTVRQQPLIDRPPQSGVGLPWGVETRGSARDERFNQRNGLASCPDRADVSTAYCARGIRGVSDFEQVQRMDGSSVAAALAGRGGPCLELVTQLAGGEVGAWLVRWPDGHDAVLTWSPPLPAGQEPGDFDRSVELMDLARRAGVPVARYEAVVPLPDGSVAIVQERIHGHVSGVVSEELVDHAIELAEIRRDLLAGTAWPASAPTLYLLDDGPGFCLHGPLRAFSRDTAELLDAIEAIGRQPVTERTTDLVHLDYHVGNLLVTDEQPDRVAAVIDWGGARPGDIGIDLAILAFDLTWRAPGPVQQRVEAHLRRTTDADTFARLWAHASLRLVDWAIRHYPHDVDYWLAVARRYL